MINRLSGIGSTVCVLIFVIIMGLFTGCAATAPKIKVAGVEEKAKKKAMDFFIEGKVAESNEEFGDAVAAYLEALYYDPNSAEITISLAQVFLRSGKIKSALQYSRRATELDPSNTESWRLLQRIEQHEGNIENAINALEMYIKLSPEKDFSDVVKLAHLYFSIGDEETAKRVIMSRIKNKYTPAYELAHAARLLEINGMLDDAVSIYKNIIERDPSDVSAWYALGILYSENGLEDEAGLTFKKGLEKNPDSIDLMKASGNHCLAIYDWECAIEFYESVIAAGDTKRQIKRTLCILYFYAGRDDEGTAAFNAMKEQGEDDSALYFSLGKSMSYLKRYEEAVRHYRTGLSRIGDSFPDDQLIKAYSGMARALIKLGRENEAVDLIHNEANKTVKDKTYLKLIESSLYIELKRYDDAIAIMEWLTASDPQNTSFYIRLSLVYDASGRFRDSEKAMLKVLEIEPDNSLALNNLAYMYMENGVKIKKAIEMVKRALEIEPDNGAYNDTLGWGYYKLGKYKNARKYIETALKLAEDFDKGVIYEHHGDILSKLGKDREAAKAYRNAIEYGEERERIQPKLDALNVE